MDQQERIDRMEQGRTAAIAHGVLSEPIQAARNNIITRLVGLYRSGQATHDSLLGGIAEIAALDNLMNHVQSAINQGNVAAEREYGNG